MQALGWTECDVVELDLSGTAATALGSALDRKAELAEWDDGARAKIIEQLRTKDAPGGVGYSPGDLGTIMEAGRASRAKQARAAAAPLWPVEPSASQPHG